MYLFGSVICKLLLISQMKFVRADRSNALSSCFFFFVFLLHLLYSLLLVTQPYPQAMKAQRVLGEVDSRLRVVVGLLKLASTHKHQYLKVMELHHD